MNNNNNKRNYSRKKPPMRAAPIHSTEDLITNVTKQYRDLLSSNVVGVVVSDCDEIIYSSNDRFLDILGYSRQDFDAGRVTWSTITPPRYDRLDEYKLKELFEKGVTGTFEKEYLQKNGQTVPVMVASEMISYTPPININFVLDLTIQKQEEFSKAKAAVVAMVGHELKTPLSVLRVQAEMLVREIKKGASTKKLLSELKDFDEQIAHIDHVLSDVLMYHTRESEKHTPAAVAEFDVAVCLKRVLSDVKLVSDRKIVLGTIERDCFIGGNESEIREVFTNLISNAIKYSPDDTNIQVSAFHKDGEIWTEVKDWGIGIKKTDQRKIFQKSYQVRHAVQAHEVSSQGIGLHLCKQIMKRHGGRIVVESELGKGSSFFCVFKALKK